MLDELVGSLRGTTGVVTAPIVGTTWDPIIDHAVFLPAAVVDLIGVSAAPANVPLPAMGTRLCDPAQTIALQSVPAGQALALPIPDACMLLGAAISAQGASIDGGGVLKLTNALDVIIGSS